MAQSRTKFTQSFNFQPKVKIVVAGELNISNGRTNARDALSTAKNDKFTNFPDFRDKVTAVFVTGN